MCGSDEEHKQCAQKNNPFANGKFLEIVGGSTNSKNITESNDLNNIGTDGESAEQDAQEKPQSYITELLIDGVKQFRCDFENCGKISKTKANLKNHQAYKHELNLKWHCCDIDDCDAKFKTSGDLKKHKKNNHKIDAEWKICGVDGCNCKFTSITNLKVHQARVHNIEVTWHVCDVEGCTEKFKTSTQLKSHKAFIHDIDIKWHVCGIDGCDMKFKDSGGLASHQTFKHDINVKWYICDVDGCGEKMKSSSSLKSHKAYKHNIDVEWFVCGEDGCTEQFKSKDDLKRHKSRKHDIDVTWHNCVEDGCNSRFKSKGDLKKHVEQVHDIGEHPCDYCANNRNSSIEHLDKNCGKVNICRDCYNKAIGKKVRKEKEWSDYLDEHFGTEYLLLNDKPLRAEGGCSMKKPDKLYTGIDIAIQAECDELQHNYWSGNYSCEQERISEIYDEPAICGKKLAVVRYNPDSYNVPRDKERLKREERLALTVKLMKHIIEHPEVMKGHIHVFYICYNHDNPKICRDLPVSLLYDEEDLNNL